MREIALATGLKNKDIIKFLHANIKAKLDFCKTIITTYFDNNFSYLLFACDETFVRPCEEIVKEVIIDYIESVYKVNFLKEKITNPHNESLAFNAYIKVLAVFDKSTDENALKDIISFNQTFFVDSFLEFRIAPLKSHWLNLAKLSSENIIMFNSRTFIDLIRFLINTMENNVYKVKVVCCEHSYKVYSIKSINDSAKKIAECNDALDLISNVFNGCPNYVDVYVNSSEQNEALNLLSNVYANRLKIYSKQ